MKYISIISLVVLTGCFSAKVTNNKELKTVPVVEITNPINNEILPTDTEIHPINIPGLTLGYIMLGVAGCCIFCSIPSFLSHRAKKRSQDQEKQDSKRIVLND